MNILSLDLPPRVRSELEKCNKKAELIGLSNIIKHSTHDLCKLTNLTSDDINELKFLAAKSIKHLSFVSSNSLGPEARLSVGCPGLDEFLQGGVAVRGITEIVGESGSGKTQICLQMCLMVQYPILSGGLDGGAVYICTEGPFPSSRLQQLTRSFASKLDINYKKPKPSSPLADNVYIEHIADAEGLKECVHSRLPKLLEQCHIKLLVIDSIAGVFRADYDSSMGASRARNLQSIGTKLHQYSRQYNMAVICVNQVTDVPSTYQGNVDSDRCKSVACLGLAWANMVTTRLQLIRSSQELRKIKVIFSPNLPAESHHFNVTASGVAAI